MNAVARACPDARPVIDGPLLRAYDAFIKSRTAEIIRAGFTADDVIELAREIGKNHALAAEIALSLNCCHPWHGMGVVHFMPTLESARANRALNQALEDADK